MKQHFIWRLLVLVLCCQVANAQWVHTNGPFAGGVLCFGVSDTNLYSGTWGGGVFVSTNCGTNWKAMNAGLTDTYIYAFAVSHDGAGGTNLVVGTLNGGVFLSTNGGTNWMALNTGLWYTSVRALAIRGTNFYAGTSSQGIVRSTNNGANWTAINTGLTSMSVRALAVLGTTLFAGTVGGGVFRSTNNGDSWTAVNSGLTNTNVYALAASGTNLFAGTWDGGVFRSTNNGGSWTAVNNGLSNDSLSALFASGGMLLAGTWGGGVFVSTDSGASWTNGGSGLKDAYINALTVYHLATGGECLFAGTYSSGIYLSTNRGASWKAVNAGLASADVRSLALSLNGAGGTDVFAGTYGGAFVSTGDYTSWASVSTGLPTNNYVRAIVVSETKLFASTSGSGVFLSTDNGAIWTPVNVGLTTTDVGTLAVSGTYLFAGTWGGGVFRSTNSGATWQAANSGLMENQIWTVAASGTNVFAGMGWAGSWGVYRSTNTGASWTYAGLTSAGVFSVVFSGTDIFAGTASGVFRSSDNGTTWIAVNNGLTNTYVWTMAVCDSSVFAGTRGSGVFLSTNKGSSWTNVSVGLGNTDVRCLAVSASDIFAGTYGGGVWRRPLSEMITPIGPHIASVDPVEGYQSYTADIEVKGAKTHFQVNPSATTVWLSKDSEILNTDSLQIHDNTRLHAYFHIPLTATLGPWNLNVETATDSILTKARAFTILPPPGSIAVSPESLHVTLARGDTSERFLRISNIGGSSLRFSASCYGRHHALHFDGVDDMVFGQMAGLPVGNSDRTMELWFNIESQPYGEGPLVAYGEWDYWAKLYILLLLPEHLCFSQWGWACVGNTVIQPHQWYHGAVVTKGDDVTLYLNGQVDQIGNQEINTGSAGSFIMGKAPSGFDSERRLNGTIDEVRIWTYARTQSQIQSDMHRELTGTEPGLAGYWQFNDSTGITAKDLSGNANRGSLVGGPQWVTSSAPVMPRWLSITQDSGECLPQSSMDIRVSFDATRIGVGHYYASLRISTNDPFHPSLTVPVHLEVSSALGVDSDVGIPRAFNLSQNYPNPFNPSTTIKYELPTQRHVQLKVYNMLGQEMAVLVDEIQEAGYKSVEFNASDLPSGVYLYRLTAGDFNQTRKLTLLK